jgi:vacuolar iron transporter family protein
MTRLKSHVERHAVSRIGWLRAAVLGANDGVVSTASLVIGVAAAAASADDVLLTGVAGLVAGAMSMAAGEYVSVSSQADSESADLARERRELRELPELELMELTSIYTAKGLTPDLARRVAEQLTAKDALAAHAQAELGIFELTIARPIQAAVASAATFATGAALPLVVVLVTRPALIVPAVSASSLVFLAALGALGARAGGASLWRAVARVTFWGAVAMAITAGIGRLFGAIV